MNKEFRSEQTTVFCGIDVSAKTLAVAVQQEKESLSEREFANTFTGHKALIAWLHKRKALVRVCLEATVIYSLDLALALDQAEGIEVAVLDPKAVNRFAQTLRRSKTDKADAPALAEYSRRMPFTAWRGPSQRGLRLRTISRYISGLTGQYTRENNRLHAAQGSASTPRCIPVDLRRSLDAIKRRLARMRKEARALLRKDETTHKQFNLIVSIPGIAEISAIHILGKLTALSPEMSVRVGRPQRTGSSPRDFRHISAAPVQDKSRWQPSSPSFALHARSRSGSARSPPEKLLPTASEQA